jgi:uncharacterized protein YegP (UPF0339 family)
VPRNKKLMYELQVLKGKSGDWYWRMVSTWNGNTLCHAETYVNKYAACKTARNLCRDLKGSRVIWEMRNGDWYVDMVNER